MTTKAMIEAGRKRKVGHRTRQRFNDVPGHLVVGVREGLPSLRKKPVRQCIIKALVAMQDRFQCRIVEFSIQTNHIHMLADPTNEAELAKAMKSFKVRVARALNQMWGLKGTFWADRYYFRLVRKVHELRRLIRYVLQNARKHGMHLPPGPDFYSSGIWFEKWEGCRGQTFTTEPCPVRPPRDMALGVAHRLPLSLDDLPGRRHWRPDPAAMEALYG